MRTSRTDLAGVQEDYAEPRKGDAEAQSDEGLGAFVEVVRRLDLTRPSNTSRNGKSHEVLSTCSMWMSLKTTLSGGIAATGAARTSVSARSAAVCEEERASRSTFCRM